MKPLGEIKTHLFLIKRMARATGADLDAALREGDLSEAEWAATVTRCRGCTAVEACEGWLAAGELSGAGPRPAPDACENRALFGALSSKEAETWAS